MYQVEEHFRNLGKLFKIYNRYIYAHFFFFASGFGKKLLKFSINYFKAMVCRLGGLSDPRCIAVPGSWRAQLNSRGSPIGGRWMKERCRWISVHRATAVFVRTGTTSKPTPSGIQGQESKLISKLKKKNPHHACPEPRQSFLSGGLGSVLP